MQQRKAEKDQGIYNNMLVPPGLQFFQKEQEQEKRHQQDEEDNHFEQYVDKCKRQTTINKSHIKIKHKGNKKIIKLIKNNSSCRSLDEQKSQNELKAYSDQISSAQILSDDIQFNQDEIIPHQQERSFSKEKSNRKQNHMNLDQTGDFQNEMQSEPQNLVDKFLVAVISPTKQRQNRNLDSFLRDSCIQDVNNTSHMKKDSSFSKIQSQKSQQINELLNKQKQILVEQLNKNHSQSISLNDQSYFKNQQNNVNLIKQDDDNMVIFQNRRSLTAKKISNNLNQLSQSKNILLSANQLTQQQLANESLQKVQSNSQFTIGHYLGEYQHSQSFFLQNKTMDSLQNDNTSKQIQQKTLFEIKKQQQINQLQEKYKQTQINKQQVDFNLQSITEKINPQTNSTIQSNSNNQQSSSSDNVLQQISHSNIGFGFPVSTKNETNQKGFKNNLISINKSSIQNSKLGMIYYNNLAQISLSESKSSKKNTKKPSLSISPNGFLNFQDQGLQLQKIQQRQNDSTSSQQANKKYNFNQNSVFDTLSNKEKVQQNISFHLKDQNNYLNRSFDLTLNIAKRIKQEKENKYNANIEQYILNNRNENSILLNSSSIYQTQENYANQKNSFSSKNALIQSNSRNFSPINCQNTLKLMQTSFVNDSSNQISRINSSQAGKNYIETNKSKTQYPANSYISVSPIMSNFYNDFGNRISKTEIDEQDQYPQKVKQEDKQKQSHENKQLIDINIQNEVNKSKPQSILAVQNNASSQLNKLNSDDFLSQISQSNIGFGIPLSNKNLTNQKRLKYHQNILQNNKQSIQNAKQEMVVVANSQGQINQNQAKNGKQSRSKTSLSLTPNNFQNYQENYFITQKSQHQQNEQSGQQQTNKKFVFNQNIDTANKDQKQNESRLNQSKDQNNYLNKSFDLSQNMENKINIENSTQINKNENGFQPNGNNIYQTHFSFINQKNSFSTRNAVILQSNSRNLSPINFQNSQNLSLSPIISSSLNPINQMGQTKIGQIVIIQSKSQNNQQTIRNTYNDQGTSNTEIEDELTKKRRMQIHSLKRSPQKGISVKKKAKQENNNINKNLKQLAQIKLTNYNLDKISSATGVSPSQIRKSLQTHLNKNIESQHGIQDANKSIQNITHDQLFAFQPLNKNIKMDSEIHDQNSQRQQQQMTPANQRSKTVGNRKYLIKGVIELQFDKI
ncbi:hypothetical protein ABPG74_022482 [Tetrahymena malaccensis]